MGLKRERVQFVNTIFKFFKKLPQVSVCFGGGLIFLIPFIIMYEVIVRYVFNRPTNWVYDFTELSLGIIMFISYSYVVLKGADVKVEMVYERVPDLWRQRIDVISGIFRITYISLIIWQAIEYWWRSYSSNWVSFSPARYPLSIPLAFFVLGLIITLGVEILKFFSRQAKDVLTNLE